MRLVSFITIFITISIGVFAQSQEESFFTIPRYFVANAEVYIKGPFDADGSNTHICFKNDSSEYVEIKSLIEDRNMVLFKIPEIYGACELCIFEKGTKNKMLTAINVIHLETTFDQLQTDQESKSKFRIELLGANQIEDEFKFSFQNLSPHVVNIVGGNSQKHKLKSRITAEELLWEGELFCIEKGAYSIKFEMVQPAPELEISTKKRPGIF